MLEAKAAADLRLAKGEISAEEYRTIIDTLSMSFQTEQTSASSESKNARKSPPKVTALGKIAMLVAGAVGAVIAGWGVVWAIVQNTEKFKGNCRVGAWLSGTNLRCEPDYTLSVIAIGIGIGCFYLISQVRRGRWF